MLFHALLAFHITAGFLGLLSGFVAITLRKGTRRHSRVGDLFVVTMLCMSASGAVIGYIKHQPENVLAGLFTFYLVSTGGMAARRRRAETGPFDGAALLTIAVLTTTFLVSGVRLVLTHGDKGDVAFYFIFGTVALLALVGDVRLLVRGGITGPPRIARHLWRMSIPLLIAANALFIARARYFPAILDRTHLLYAPGLATLVTMIFWLIRIRSKSVAKRLPLEQPAPAVSVEA